MLVFGLIFSRIGTKVKSTSTFWWFSQVAWVTLCVAGKGWPFVILHVYQDISLGKFCPIGCVT